MAVVKYNIRNDVINSLVEASFKSKTFFWQSTEIVTGREKKTFSSIGDGGASPSQDLGKKQKVYTVVMKPTPTTPDGYQELLNLLEQEDAGILQLPDLPSFLAEVTSVRGSNDKRALNDYSIEVDFIPSQQLIFPEIDNTIGSLENLEDTTRKSLIENAIEKIADFNLAATIGDIANAIDNVLYKFPNNNTYLKAISNVINVTNTVKSLAKSYSGRKPELGTSGSQSSNVVLDKVIEGKQVTGINTVEGIVRFFGDVYSDLASSDFIDNNDALNVFLELNRLEFPLDIDRPWNLASNMNSTTLNVLNKQLALLQYCNVAIKMNFSLQRDLDLVISNIIDLNNDIAQAGAINSTVVSEYVSSVLGFLKNEKTADYRVSPKVVYSTNIWNICYDIFENLNDNNLDLLKRVNPNIDYGNMTGRVNIVVSNT